MKEKDKKLQTAKEKIAKYRNQIKVEPMKQWDMYRDLVWKGKNKGYRPITEIEKMIVVYCFSHSHHYTTACSNLGFNLSEFEPFSEEDLFEAAKAIYFYERKYYRKNKNKSTKSQILLWEVHKYLINRQAV